MSRRRQRQQVSSGEETSESSSTSSSLSNSESSSSASSGHEIEEEEELIETEELQEMEVIDEPIEEPSEEIEEEVEIIPTKKKSKSKKTKQGKEKEKQDEKGDEEGGDDEALVTPKPRGTKKGNTKTQKPRKGPQKVTDTLHCIDVVTFLDAAGLDLACLIMATKSPKALKIFCVRLDDTTRLMTSPFYEHKVSMEAENDRSTRPSSFFLNCFTNGAMYNVVAWHDTIFRLGPDPMKLSYVPTMREKIATILRETFFFCDVTGAVKDVDEGLDMDENGEILDDEELPIIESDHSDDLRSSKGVKSTSTKPNSDENAKNAERARIIQLLLKDTPHRQNVTNEADFDPSMGLINEPLHIRWYDPQGETRKLTIWLQKFVALNERATTEKWCLKDHSRYWITIDSDPERANEMILQFYNTMKPRTSLTETGTNIFLTADHMRHSIYTWKPFAYISILIAANLDTMHDLFYIHTHIHLYDSPGVMRFEKFSHHEMSDMAQLMRHVDHLFALHLPAVTVNTANAAQKPVAGTLTVSESKYYDYKKLIKNASIHIQHIVLAYRAKYDVTDEIHCRIIKLAIMQHIIIPYIVSEIDQKAKLNTTMYRSTCHIVTLKAIADLFASFTGIKFESPESVIYQENTRLIINAIKERENVQFKGNTTYVDPTSHRDEHSYSFAFHHADLCQIMSSLYKGDDENGSSVILREASKNPWVPVFDNISRITGDTMVDIDKVVLFHISTTDTDTTNHEERIHTIINTHLADDTQIFDEIDSLLVPNVASPSVTSRRVNIALTTVHDILQQKDARLIHHVTQMKASGTIVIVSANSGYARGMLPRYFMTQKMPNFYNQYCMTVDQLAKDLAVLTKKSKTNIVIPYLHLMSPKELHQILRCLTNNGTTPIVVNRLFITGTIDMIAPTPGQVFIDFLRCINYGHYNSMLWNFVRPVDSFDCIMRRHWRIVELIERGPLLATRFLKSFNRMTTTVCHGIKDLWYVKDVPTLAYYISALQNKTAQPTDNAQQPQLIPYKSITINLYNRNNNNYTNNTNNKNTKMSQILKESLRIEARNISSNHVSIIYNEFTAPLDTLQFDRHLTGYSLGYDEVKHINRHVFVISMPDIAKLSRNELHILFSMVNNLFIIDNPFVPAPTPTTRNTASLSPLPPQWHAASPDFAQDRIIQHFVELDSHAICRTTYETYIHKLNTLPLLRTNGVMDDVMTKLPDLTIKRKHSEPEKPDTSNRMTKKSRRS